LTEVCSHVCTEPEFQPVHNPDEFHLSMHAHSSISVFDRFPPPMDLVSLYLLARLLFSCQTCAALCAVVQGQSIKLRIKKEGELNIKLYCDVVEVHCMD